MSWSSTFFPFLITHTHTHTQPPSFTPKSTSSPAFLSPSHTTLHHHALLLLCCRPPGSRLARLGCPCPRASSITSLSLLSQTIADLRFFFFPLQRGTLGNLQETVEGATADLGTTVAGLGPSGGVVGNLVTGLLGPATPVALGGTVAGLGQGLGPTVGGLATSGGAVGGLVGSLVGPVKVRLTSFPDAFSRPRADINPSSPSSARHARQPPDDRRGRDR